METKAQSFEIKGVIPPLITPLHNHSEIDPEGLEKLLNHVISGGVHGVFILGTTGEGSSLPVELKMKLISRVTSIVDRRIPVLVSITDPVYANVTTLSAQAEKCNADAVVIAPPYYFPLSPLEFETYLEKIAAQIDIPFLLYNMPVHTKFSITEDLVLKAKDLGAIGIKDSSGDLDHILSLIKLKNRDERFSIICGSEIFLSDAIAAGGDGVIAGGANIFPSIFVDLYYASLSNDSDSIKYLKSLLDQIEKTIYRVGPNYSRAISGIKCAASVMNLCSNYLAPPLMKLNGKRTSQIKSAVTCIEKHYAEYAGLNYHIR